MRPLMATKKSAKKTAKKPAKPAAKLAPAAEKDQLVGKPLPKFELADHAGKSISSKALGGEPFVLYFYPKDDTPGCTKEACDFRDGIAGFKRAGLRVIGVSPDSSATHSRFREKYKLPFQLLSDPDKNLAKAMGVWVKKINYGREYMGVQRSTFLVDQKGVVRRAWRGVKVPGHVDQVLAAARELG
jgi:peroxiredoxin Q/BCP